ncbi:putative nuclease of putative toxin-antitoxin system [Chitinophaga terrae (ex Kim and Jung 2007)]|nr:putative nuclease of putative toxin-antitoxin system [Chitinophaga terrae (ex Kim and Jung 2007)]GEP90021.1 hypothetical protein CTE07_16660 [Chitinophaga terrae (ex Kim and Jung 2007)]
MREVGFEIFSIAEQSHGISDELVLEIAHENGSLLITQDKDFGDLVYRLGKAHEGVILLRSEGLTPYQKADLCLILVTQHTNELPGAFTVVYKDYVKIRKGNK